LSYKSIDCAALKTFDFDLSLLQFIKAGASTVTFIHEKIHSVCSSISQTRGKIRDEIGAVFGAFVSGLKEHQESFQTVISFVTDVDLMQNQAHVACTYKYCKPAIKQNSGEKKKIKRNDRNNSSLICGRARHSPLFNRANQ
jgi:DNA mismatch repair ATPase MutS